MCDYESSSQLKSWLYTPNQLEKCRERVNRQARAFLVAQQQQQHDNNNNNNNDHHHQSMSDIGDTPKPPSSSPPPVYSFAANFAHRNETMQEDDDDGLLTSTTTANDDDHFLTPHEEGLLVAFYASKLPSLIGPMAQVPRLRRDVKVAATASLLYHRFYLSNSVMLHDPKTIMVAAAFLGSKVEDAMSDVRYLEEGTKLMNAPVSVAEILFAELNLLEGIHFDLLCFHPYKAVLAFTEDLRTFLKSDKGRTLAHFRGDDNNNSSNNNRLVVGQDLKPMHDGARRIIDHVIVSDIPLLYSPGQIGLAALMVTNEELQNNHNDNDNSSDQNVNVNELPPRIDLLGYVQHRFEDSRADHLHDDSGGGNEFVRETLIELCHMLVGLREGKHGCCCDNHNNNKNVDLGALKRVHKKLKKVRVWKKSNKKRKGTTITTTADEEESEPKRTKTL